MKKSKQVMPQQPPATTLQDCTFVGVQWDQSSLEVVGKVAQGLLNLSELFKSQNVKVDSLLHFGSDVQTVILGGATILKTRE